MTSTFWLWIIFNLFVVFLLYLDLAVFHKKDHEIKIKEAVIWSIIWIAMALVFNAGVWVVSGHKTALNFFTGYVLEKSLSVDNLFVFLMIFSYFQVPAKYHHKILFWGIIGAIVTRALFIFGGVALIERFHWILYFLGALLIYSGYKFLHNEEKEVHPEKNPVLKLFRRFMPVTQDYHEGHFSVRLNGKLHATPLLVVLIVIETTDVVFAVDSIPAILSITLDPFIVYSSNIFAILGLRALYFALAGLMKAFYYLNYGLGIILMFVGIKMCLSSFYHVPTWAALGVIAVVLTGSILASIWFPKKEVSG